MKPSILCTLCGASRWSKLTENKSVNYKSHFVKVSCDMATAQLSAMSATISSDLALHVVHDLWRPFLFHV